MKTFHRRCDPLKRCCAQAAIRRRCGLWGVGTVAGAVIGGIIGKVAMGFIYSWGGAKVGEGVADWTGKGTGGGCD